MNGEQHVVKWESMPGFFRCFCGRCGSVVPGAPVGNLMFVPVGSFDDDPGARAEMHIFVGSKPPWFEITDDIPQFEAYPKGLDLPVVPDRAPLDPPGRPRGSCLCGGVTYVVEGEPIRSFVCHCGRCRLARSAARALNFFTRADGVRFTRGADIVNEYKVPDAKHFTHAFCRTCGSGVPRIDPGRDLAIIAMAGLDDDPGVRPSAHIFVGSKAAWDPITDSLPQHAAYPTA